MITNVPLPQKNTLNYTLSATVYPETSSNFAYYYYPAKELQNLPSAGVFRISRIKLDSNIAPDAFAEAFLFPSGYENSFNIGIQYDSGRVNPLFIRDFYVKHLFEIDVNQYFTIDGLNPKLIFVPSLFVSAVNSVLAGRGIPKLHLMLTIEQCTDSDFEKALQEGRI